MFKKYANGLDGLNWTVRKDSVYGPDGKPIADYSAIVREDSGEVLSIMGADYETVQNSVIAEFARLIPSKSIEAGEMHGGKVTYVSVESADEFGIPGVKGDSVKRYTHFATSHDGTYSVIGGGTGTRPI